VGDQKVFIANTGKARNLVGWEPHVPLAEGLTEIVSWSKTRWACQRRDVAVGSVQGHS
jgi:nucleoside-diphosphate-sugar epimerase